MKKLISLLMVMVMLLSVPAYAAIDLSETSEQVENTEALIAFEDYEEYNFLKNVTYSGTANDLFRNANSGIPEDIVTQGRIIGESSTLRNENVGGEHGNVATFTANAKMDAWLGQIHIGEDVLNGLADKYFLSFDMYLKSTATNKVQFTLLDTTKNSSGLWTATTSLAQVGFNAITGSEGRMYIGTNANGVMKTGTQYSDYPVKGKPFTRDQWHSVEMLIDTTAKTVTYYLDGNVIKEGDAIYKSNFGSTCNGNLGTITIMSQILESDTFGGDGMFSIDNLRISNVTDTVFDAKASLSGNKVKVEFSEIPEAYATNGITVTDGENSVAVKNMSAKGRFLTFDIGNIEPNKEYFITLPESLESVTGKKLADNRVLLWVAEENIAYEDFETLTTTNSDRVLVNPEGVSGDLKIYNISIAGGAGVTAEPPIALKEKGLGKSKGAVFTPDAAELNPFGKIDFGSLVTKYGDKYSVSFDIYLSSTPSVNLSFRDTSGVGEWTGNNLVTQFGFKDNRINIPENATGLNKAGTANVVKTARGNIATGKWYDVEIIVDKENKKVKYYLNNALIVEENTGTAVTDASIKELRIVCLDATADTEMFVMDNIKVANLYSKPGDNVFSVKSLALKNVNGTVDALSKVVAGDIWVDLSVSNMTSSTKEMLVLLALYDENNILIGVGQTSGTSASVAKNAELDITEAAKYTITAEKASEVKQIKVFVWENTNNAPLCENYYLNK